MLLVYYYSSDDFVATKVLGVARFATSRHGRGLHQR